MFLQIRFRSVALSAVAAVFALACDSANAQQQSLLQGGAGTSRQDATGQAGTNLGAGFGTNPFSNSQGLGTTTNANQGFIGRSNQANEFIGRGDPTQGVNRGGQQNRSINRRSGGGNANRNFRQRGATQETPIQPRLRVAFTFQKTRAAVVTRTARTHLDGVVLRKPSLKGVNFVLDDKGVLTLRGEVETLNDSKLAAALFRLEPGIRKVANELTIKPATAGG